MADVKSKDVPDPLNGEAFQRWLETKPSEWSVVIAARAALRALPLGWRSKFGTREASDILLPNVRAIAIARLASLIQRRAIDEPFRTAIVRAANASRDGAPPNSSRHAAAAGAAAFGVPIYKKRSPFPAGTVSRYIRSSLAKTATAAAAVKAVAAANSEAAACTGDTATFAATVRQDALDLHAGTSPDRLARAALWPATGVLATEIRHAWRRLVHDLCLIDRSWDVWIDWYENVLGGFPKSPRLSARDNEALEAAAFTDVESPLHPWGGLLPWDDGPGVVNRAIKERLDRLRAAISVSPKASGAMERG